MGARLKEIEIKETQDSRKREMNKLRDMVSLRSVDGKRLFIFLSDLALEQQNFCEYGRQELELFDEPGKVILEVFGELYRESAEVGNIGKRSCVVLLEQLATLRPRITPPVKAEAASLARQWGGKIGTEGQNSVLEVLGFLLLLRAYDLFDEFDSAEVLTVIRSSGKVRAGEPGIELRLANNDSASTSLVSQLKTTGHSLEQDSELVNLIASTFNCTFDALRHFCSDMNGKNLKLFLYEYLQEHDWSTEVHDALSQAPDPAKLILDAMPGFLCSQFEFQKSLLCARVQKICILLEQLMIISPHISDHVSDEALKLAQEWGLKKGQIFHSPMTAYGFLLFLAAYRMNSMYEVDELLRIFGIASEYKTSLGLGQTLGLADKAEVLVQNLIQKDILLDAVDYAHAYNLVEKFPPVHLLKNYLRLSKRRIYGQGKSSSLQQAWDKEIAVTRTIIKYILKHGLESEYPPEDLEKHILELEKKKSLNAYQGTNFPIAHLSSASTSNDPHVEVEASPKEHQLVDNQVVKAEPSPKEDLQLESQVEKPGNKEPSSSTLCWPLLKSICVSTYKKGLSFFSHKHKLEIDSMASSSINPWPELKSICANMDGERLMTFLYDQVDDQDNDQDLLCSTVCDALKCAPDPAKLVLDVLQGRLRSQPAINEIISLNKIRNSHNLLLEQLVAISPQINAQVTEEALNKENQWRSQLNKKYLASGHVYGFLLFVAAYGLVNKYGVDEILCFMVSANRHKAAPSLFRILGFEKKILGLVQSLIENKLWLEAIEHIYEFNVVSEFPPVPLLKDYLIANRANRVGSNSPSKTEITKEINATRTVIACITKYKLESQYSVDELENRIVELEKKKIYYDFSSIFYTFLCVGTQY